MNGILKGLFLGNPVWIWALALGVAFSVHLFLRVIFTVLIRKFDVLAQKTENYIDDIFVEVLKSTSRFFLFFIALNIGILFIHFPPRIHSIFEKVSIIILIFQIAFWVNAGIGYFMFETGKRKREHDPASVSAFGAIRFFAKAILWVGVFLLILSNLGIDISALITGLGVGGIAIALAVQNILGDIFGSLAILLDKPFEVGDFIVIGDKLGIVERIGIKTTRLRSLSGEQVIFTNADLIGSRIHNFKKMYQRRVVFGFGLVYQTTLEQLKKTPEIVKKTITSQDNTRFDRAHFKSYGDSSLDFEVVYYVLSGDYNIYMDIQQHINLELFRIFEEEGISFAYPTRTVIVENSLPSLGDKVKVEG